MEYQGCIASRIVTRKDPTWSAKVGIIRSMMGVIITTLDIVLVIASPALLAASCSFLLLSRCFFELTIPPISIHDGWKGVSDTTRLGHRWLMPSSLVYGGRRFALISPNWITGIFVAMDCVSIVAQSIGAAMLFNDSLSLDELKRARLILEAGLFVQVIGFSIFLFVAIWFDVKTTRHLGERIAHLRWFMNAFYISGGLIMIRSIYRLTGTYNFLSIYRVFFTESTAEFITIDFDTRPPSGYLYSEFFPSIF